MSDSTAKPSPSAHEALIALRSASAQIAEPALHEALERAADVLEIAIKASPYTPVSSPLIARMTAIGLLAAGATSELRSSLREAHDILREIVNRLDHAAATARGPLSISYHDATVLRANVADAFLAAGRALRLGDDLQRLATPGGPEPVATDINRLVESALHLVSPRLRRGADVFVDYSFLPEVRVYPDRLALAIAHVLLNAVEATAETGSIQVMTQGSAEEVEVAVTDTGVGIARDALDRIFEPGFTTRPGGGGLGLAIVRETLVEHGGRIEIDSVEGAGTKVRLILPAGQDQGSRR